LLCYGLAHLCILFRIGINLTLKKKFFALRFTVSVYVIKTNQLMLFMEIIDDFLCLYKTQKESVIKTYNFCVFKPPRTTILNT